MKASLRPLLFLLLLLLGFHYQFIIFGKIPFPGDLMVNSYLPWLDYHHFPIKNPLISDVFSQFFIWKHLAIEIWRTGQVPFWNPYSFMGTPFLATYHSAVLYPLNILLLLPKYYGWGIFIASQTIISGLTFYLLSSLWIKHRLARIPGALIYATGGLATTWLEFGTAGHALAWLPLAIWTGFQLLNTTSWYYLIGLIFSLSAIILAGNPQLTAYSLALIISLTIFQPKRWWLIISALGLSLLITAPQILTSLEFLSRSIRSSDNYISMANYGLLPLSDLIRLGIADFYGHPGKYNYWGFLNYSETSSFIGILSLPLLIYSLFNLSTNRIVFYWQAVLAIFLIITFDNPLSRMLYSVQIPLLTQSFASRGLFIIGLAIAILSSLSLNQIIERQDFKTFRRYLMLVVAGLVGLIIGSILARLLIDYLINNLSGPAQTFFFKDPTHTSLKNLVPLRNTLWALGIAGMGLIIVYFAKFLGRFGLIVSTLAIIGLLNLDLGRHFFGFNPFVPTDQIFPTTPAITYLQNQPGQFRVGREHAEILTPNIWTAYDLSAIEGYDPIYSRQYAQWINHINGVDALNSQTSRYAEISNNYGSQWLNAANVRYFVGILHDENGFLGGDQPNYKFDNTPYRMVYKDRSTAVLENPTVYPRAYFIKNTTLAPTPTDTFRIFNDPQFLATQTATLSQPIHPSSFSATGSAIITDYQPNHITLSTQTDSPQLLILAEQYDPNWQATLDQNPVTIHQANYVFRGIEVPTGQHQIRLSYSPNSFKTGLYLSLIGIILLAAEVLILVRVSKDHKSPSQNKSR